MILASAYPDSAISALSMMAIAFVMAACLAIWIGMVFIADREPRKGGKKQSHAYTTVVAVTPGKTTEDGHGEPGQHGVAA